jgi:hypothetical protein
MARAVPYLVIAALLTGFLVVFGLIAFEGANRVIDSSEEALDDYVPPPAAPVVDEFTPMVPLEVSYGERPLKLTAPIPASHAALRAMDRQTSPIVLETSRRDPILLGMALALRDPRAIDEFVNAMVAVHGPNGSATIEPYFGTVLSLANMHADICHLISRLLEEDLLVRGWLMETFGDHCPGGSAIAAERERYSFAELAPDAIVADASQDLAYHLSLCDEGERPLLERALMRCATDAAEPNERAVECLRVLAGSNWGLARRAAEAIERLGGEMAGWDEVRSLRRFASSAEVERAAADASLMSIDEPRLNPSWSEVSVLHVLLNRSRALCFGAPSEVMDAQIPFEHTWMLGQLARVAGLDEVDFEAYWLNDRTVELFAYMRGNVYRGFASFEAAFDAYTLTGFVNALLAARGLPDRLVGISGAGNCVARNGGSVGEAVAEGYFSYLDLRAAGAGADSFADGLDEPEPPLDDTPDDFVFVEPRGSTSLGEP